METTKERPVERPTHEMPDPPKHPDLVYDVGMHKGEDSAFYLAKGFRVVGFEADPELAAHCRRRLAPFLEAGRLEIVEGAIVDGASMPPGGDGAPRRVAFHRNRDHSVWGTVHAEWAGRNERLGTASDRIEVDLVDFAEVLRRTGVPRYMKIDIEGADMVCVETLRRFRTRPDYLSIESDKTSLAAIRRELATLRELGYDRFQAVEQSAIPRTQRPPLPAREGVDVEHRFEPGSSGLFGAELGGRWRSAREVLGQYRFIRLGYLLEGDDGIALRWRFPGSERLRWMLRRAIGRLAGGAVPGWYDTHARHVDAVDR
jgi:FkbM family methyltransferase